MDFGLILIALSVPPSTNEGWLQSLRLADAAFFASETLTVLRSANFDRHYPQMGRKVDELR